MSTQLTTTARTQLTRIGYSAAMISEIERSPSLTTAANRFITLASRLRVATGNEATQWNPPTSSNTSNIQINISVLNSYPVGEQRTQEAIRLLSHELGHALGRSQAGSTSNFTTPQAYNLARGTGEAEAFLLEYNTRKELGGVYMSGSYSVDQDLFQRMFREELRQQEIGIPQSQIDNSLLTVARDYNLNAQPNGTPSGTTYQQQNYFYWALDACNLTPAQRDLFTPANIQGVAAGITNPSSTNWSLDIRSSAGANGDFVVCQKSPLGTPQSSTFNPARGLRFSLLDADNDGWFDALSFSTAAPAGPQNGEFSIDETSGEVRLMGLQSINGQTPANAPIINAAVLAGNFDLRDILGTGDFSNGDLSGSVINGDLAQIIAAADPTNAAGTPALPATSTPAPTPGSPGWAAWVNSEEGKRFYAALTNTQNLLAAAQGGNPVPLVQDIFNFADSALQETNPILASQFGGAANGLGTVNSFRSLARAIERGDPVEIARSGAPVASYIISTYAASLSNQIISQFGVANIAEAQAERFWNQSQGTPNQNLNELLDQYSGTQNLLESINRGLPYLQLLSGLKNGDPISIGIGGAYVGGQIGLWAPVGQAGSAAASFVTTLNWIGAIVVIIQLLRGDDDARALVQAASTGDGRSVTAQLVGSPEDGGDGPALATYAELIKAVNKLIEQRADQGIIASRLPQLEFYAGDKRKLDQGFYKLVWTDEAGNRQERQYRYNGSLAATGGDELAQMPEFFLNLVENYTRLAQESGAIAPSWIVQTIDAQVARSVPIPIYEDRPRYGAEREIVGYDRVQVGSTLPANADPDAGLTTEQRAAMREQLLATDPGDASSNNAGGNTAASQQSVRPIVLDLEGNGIQLTRRANAGGVLLDVDDDGFAEQTDWIGAKEGILVADLDGDGQIRGGHEMFNDSQVDMSQRGLEVLREYDANGDGTITAADAALNHLKIWQDVNHDGIAQSHELSTLAQNSITELNYSTGQFTQSNAQGSVQKTLVLAELVASSAGVVSLQHHKHYEFNSTSRIFYAGYLPEMIQKEAGNDVSWRALA